MAIAEGESVDRFQLKSVIAFVKIRTDKELTVAGVLPFVTLDVRSFFLRARTALPFPDCASREATTGIPSIRITANSPSVR